MEKYNSRKEVPEEYKWDLTDFFKNDGEFNDALEIVKKKIAKLKDYVGCTKDANKLYEFLCLDTEVEALWEDLYVYAYLINDQELGHKEAMERKNTTEVIATDMEANTAFFAPELLKLEKSLYDKLFQDNKKLLEYKAELDAIYRGKDHILKEDEEKNLVTLVNAINHFADMSSNLINGDHDYGKIKLDNGKTETIAVNNYSNLMRNKNEKIRKTVYNKFNKKLNEYATTSASLLNSYVSLYVSLAKIHKYDNAWSQKLFGLNLNDKVFTTLIQSVEDNLTVLNKYYELKKHVLNKDILNPWDLKLDLTNSAKEYSIKDAQDIIKEALKPLGDDYLSKYDRIIKNRYIDYCQYKGKCSGGYSFSTINHDSRILLSFNGDFDSISTIIHECGHNVHHQYIMANNPEQYREPGSIVSEVASLTNEFLLSDYFVKNAQDKNEKLLGLENILRVIASNLYGAVREGVIEQEMYKLVENGGLITKEFLNDKTKSSLAKYYGPAVKLDKYVENGWITRSHYYMFFYLFSYAICVSVASNVASKILKGDKEMLEKYLNFLKTGSDAWPHEAFKVLGIDLEDKSVYENAIKYFDELIANFYKIYDGKE